MSRSFRFRHFPLSLASVFAGAVALGGCAASDVDSPTEPAPAPSTEASSKEVATDLASAGEFDALGSSMLGASSAESFAFEMSASLVKSIAGHAIVDALFPSRNVDLRQLIDSVDANTRAALVQMVLDSYNAIIEGARYGLQTIQMRFQVSGPSPSLANQTDGIILQLNPVIGGVGPNASNAAYKRDGRRIYALAAQMMANAYFMQLQLETNPKQADGIRATLKQHLQQSIDGLNARVNELRSNAIQQRVAAIGVCTWRESGVLPRSKQQWVGFNDGNREVWRGGDPGSCWIDREKYQRSTEQTFANDMNATYEFETRMIDGWAAAIAQLDDKPAPQRGRALSLDFGGAFGMGTWQNPNGRPYNNLLTNAYSCPGGFQEWTMLGRNNVDWYAAQCWAKPNVAAEPRWDFGGFRGTFPTPLTGSDPIRICPNGFIPLDHATMIHYSPDVDDHLYFCARPHTPGTPQTYLFGGAYSRGGVDGVNSWINPATNAASCPIGFTTTSVQGSMYPDGRTKDHALFMCWKGYEAFTP